MTDTIRNKKIFLLGDFKSNTGPAIANRGILEALTGIYNLYFSQRNGIILRILEVIIHIIKCDILVITSKSQLNYIAIYWALFLRKKIIYIMHGHSLLEYKTNTEYSQRRIDIINRLEKYENFICSKSHKLIFVSKKSMELMMNCYNEYAYKMDYIWNVVKLDKQIQNPEVLSDNLRDNLRDNNIILSLGGDRKIKNNLDVARAIDYLNDKYHTNFKYIVVGEIDSSKSSLLSYKCVESLGKISHEEVLLLMKKANIYVQNSFFETFGMAPLEALLSGCSLLITKNMGVIDIFDNLENEDYIEDNENYLEIADKVYKIYIYANNQRLIHALNSYYISIDFLKERLQKIISTTI